MVLKVEANYYDGSNYNQIYFSHIFQKGSYNGTGENIPINLNLDLSILPFCVYVTGNGYVDTEQLGNEIGMGSFLLFKTNLLVPYTRNDYETVYYSPFSYVDGKIYGFSGGIAEGSNQFTIRGPMNVTDTLKRVAMYNHIGVTYTYCTII